MDSWHDEVREAVVAGEREFGLLDAHQTVKHNLARRCQEILAEEPQLVPVEERPGVCAEGDLR